MEKLRRFSVKIWGVTFFLIPDFNKEKKNEHKKVKGQNISTSLFVGFGHRL
jgi:hypothetical protein